MNETPYLTLLDSMPSYYEKEEDVQFKNENTENEWIAPNNFIENLEGQEQSHESIAKALKMNYILMSDGDARNYIYNYPKGSNIWKRIGEKALDGLTINVCTPGTKKSKRTEAWQQVTSEFCKMNINWNNIKDYEIPLKEGILDFRTNTISHHKPEYFIDRVIPHKYNPKAKCKLWEKYLDEWFENDKEKKLFLQEFFGYIITTAHAKYKQALILLGKPNTGKSQIQDVAESLVGKENVTAIDIQDFGDPKKIADIKGKFLNVSSDIEQDALLSAGGFKRLVSNGDSILIDQKYEPMERITPTAKFIIVTNHMLKITSDSSGGAFDRMTIIKLHNVVPENKRDPFLIQKLNQEEEMSGILNWAIEGARRLWKNKGKWTKVKESEALKQENKIMNNPILDFINNSGIITFHEKAYTPVMDFKEAFNKWNGRSWTSNSITKKMKEYGYKKAKKKGGAFEAWIGFEINYEELNKIKNKKEYGYV